MTLLRKAWDYLKTHNIFSKVVGTLLTLIVVFVWTDVIKKYNWLGKAWEGIVWFFSLYDNTFEIPVWGIILLLFIVPVLLGLILLIIGAFSKDSSNSRPEFLKYTWDTFDTTFLVKWGWGNHGQGYFPHEFTYHCPADGCKIVGIDCPVCKKRWNKDPLPEEEMIALIEYKIENKTWPKQN